jgi:hypothetical protein
LKKSSQGMNILLQTNRLIQMFCQALLWLMLNSVPHCLHWLLFMTVHLSAFSRPSLATPHLRLLGRRLQGFEQQIMLVGV